MKRHFLAQTSTVLPKIARELESLTLDGPHEVIVQPFQKRISDPQRAVLHSMIRDIARAANCSEATAKHEMKSGQVTGIEWPVELKQGLTGERLVPVDTMKLTPKQTNDLIDQIGAYGSEHGVEWSRVEHWEDVA